MHYPGIPPAADKRLHWPVTGRSLKHICSESAFGISEAELYVNLSNQQTKHVSIYFNSSTQACSSGCPKSHSQVTGHIIYSSCDRSRPLPREPNSVIFIHFSSPLFWQRANPQTLLLLQTPCGFHIFCANMSALALWLCDLFSCFAFSAPSLPLWQRGQSGQAEREEARPRTSSQAPAPAEEEGLPVGNDAQPISRWRKGGMWKFIVVAFLTPATA